MQIDWITVSAQIVNFLVLVYLLQHFLYQPVINAMDRREKRIADRLREAESRERDAVREAGQFAERSRQLDSERTSLLDQYRREALDEKQRLLETASDEIARTRRQWRGQVEQEKGLFLDDLRRQTGTAIAGIARKALSDLADEDLENRVIDVFIARIERAEDQALDVFSMARGALRVASAFELDRRRRERVTRVLEKRLGRDAEILFEVDPQLICGIQLRDDGHSVGWSVADYLDQVADSVSGVLDGATRPV